MKILFTKAHGAHNDFLLTWAPRLPEPLSAEARKQVAIAICDRHTGIGADGWIVMSSSESAHAAIELWNSDGSRSEISGNGTRCAAALIASWTPSANDIAILTGAGLKHLKLLNHSGSHYDFEMNMGRADIQQLESPIVPGRDAVILNVGNPQCAVFVDDGDFNFDWRTIGAELERHERFPNRTNVSFIKVIDKHSLDVRFFERGAGETMSSGTGSTGAFAAALACGLVESPVEVRTPAGPLQLRLENQDILLAGPAQLIASGEYLWQE